jgi:hypothetical protein
VPLERETDESGAGVAGVSDAFEAVRCSSTRIFFERALQLVRRA